MSDDMTDEVFLRYCESMADTPRSGIKRRQPSTSRGTIISAASWPKHPDRKAPPMTDTDELRKRWEPVIRDVYSSADLAAANRTSEFVADLFDRLQAVEAERDHHQLENVTLGICVDKLTARAEAAEARLTEARETLRPFVEAWKSAAIIMGPFGACTLSDIEAVAKHHLPGGAIKTAFFKETSHEG